MQRTEKLLSLYSNHTKEPEKNQKVLPYRQGLFIILLVRRSLTFGDGNIAFQAVDVSYSLLSA
jgi:hypothetical protein